MKKLSILVVGAAGYVLGSRAGRERYEQIKRQAQKTWQRPAVQNAVDDVEQAVRSKASDVGSKVAEAASDAGSKVVHKVTGGEEDPAPTPTATQSSSYS
ncbi:MAG: hypothetical protein QOJ72_63 [Nocardioidaceae bacterium]|nr:hypothetical protein [Nocardioidaceae bacterium]